MLENYLEIYNLAQWYPDIYPKWFVEAVKAHSAFIGLARRYAFSKRLDSTI